eukprot:GHVL01004777.1.p1 GENE.GHVL01004777.1~~GHVL01004777.1.p1  ORF type:complete len:328 (+),score=26.83 GHVL01004777.1:133-1116(+)
MTEGSDSRIEWTNSLNTNPQQPRKQTDFFLILFCVITMSLVTIIPACIKLPLQQRTRTLNFDGTKTVAAHYTLSLKHIKISLNFCQFGKRYTDMRWPPKLIKAHDLECKLWRSWVSPDFKATQHQSGMKFVAKSNFKRLFYNPGVCNGKPEPHLANDEWINCTEMLKVINLHQVLSVFIWLSASLEFVGILTFFLYWIKVLAVGRRITFGIGVMSAFFTVLGTAIYISAAPDVTNFIVPKLVVDHLLVWLDWQGIYIWIISVVGLTKLAWYIIVGNSFCFHRRTLSVKEPARRHLPDDSTDPPFPDSTAILRKSLKNLERTTSFKVL